MRVTQGDARLLARTNWCFFPENRGQQGAADLPADRLKTLISQARDTFPRAGNYDQASAWAGVRPATPSGRPIIDQICYRNLYANMGHGALGLTLAAGSAALLADRIAGRQSAIDPSPFTLAKA